MTFAPAPVLAPAPRRARGTASVAPGNSSPGAPKGHLGPVCMQTHVVGQTRCGREARNQELMTGRLIGFVRAVFHRFGGPQNGNANR
eukprot:8635107-Alexandrium_andersonii.AAC.1